jgi:four helix bundle protein
MEELKILQKTYDMVLYGNQCLQQFPRSERYALATDIKKSMYTLLRLIITANKRYYKKTTLQDIDIELDALRTFIRLAADQNFKYLPLRKYENWSKMLNEIGKMLGGWIKSTKN